jgi:pimeloyl-ACP methyl ester carboxylesterase
VFIAAFACSGGVHAADQSRLEVTLPLDQGRLNLRDVIVSAGRGLGINAQSLANKLDWTINVDSALGTVQLSLLDRLAHGVLTTEVKGQCVVVTVDHAELKRKLAESSQSLEAWVEELADDLTRRQQRNYGITFATPLNDRTLLADMKVAPEEVVLLVHGLDDPGFMWRDLIPELQQRGLSVARFEYPNDGPIAESADLLASCLSELSEAGVREVDVVAHSMGGLVVRDVLTRPEHYAGNGAASNAKELPAIDQLIMLGTPNHGSSLARLRGLAELREHFYRAWQGDRGWLAPFNNDGAGEAGMDLLPGSKFLQELNSRAHATHTRYTIIAGECGTEVAGDLKQAADHARKLAESSSAPQWLRDMLADKPEDAALKIVGQTMNELGDGCVTVQSAKLEGINDFQVVPGNHLSIVVNVADTTRDERMPPAIPIILDRLAQVRQTAEH